MWDEFQEKLSDHLQASGEHCIDGDFDCDDDILINDDDTWSSKGMEIYNNYKATSSMFSADVHWGDQNMQWTTREVLQQHHGGIIIIIIAVIIIIIIIIIIMTTTIKVKDWW